jgi:hypothetical protein
MLVLITIIMCTCVINSGFAAEFVGIFWQCCKYYYTEIKVSSNESLALKMVGINHKQAAVYMENFTP